MRNLSKDAYREIISVMLSLLVYLVVGKSVTALAVDTLDGGRNDTSPNVTLYQAESVAKDAFIKKSPSIDLKTVVVESELRMSGPGLPRPLYFVTIKDDHSAFVEEGAIMGYRYRIEAQTADGSPRIIGCDPIYKPKSEPVEVFTETGSMLGKVPFISGTSLQNITLKPSVSDHSFSFINAVAMSRLEPGHFAIVGEGWSASSSDDRPLVTKYYRSDGAVLWGDATWQIGTLSTQSIAEVESGTFAIAGSLMKQETVQGELKNRYTRTGALRIVRAVPGFAPQGKTIYYDGYSSLTTLETTKRETLLACTNPSAGTVFILILNKEGNILKAIPALSVDNPASAWYYYQADAGAIITSIDNSSDVGNIVVFANSSGSILLASYTINFRTGELIRQNWNHDVIAKIPKMKLEIHSGVVMKDGAFALGGVVTHGSIARDLHGWNGLKFTDENIFYEQSILLGFNANGKTLFEYRGSKSWNEGDVAYEGLAYNATSQELAAAGHFKHTGLLDIFDQSGKFLAHGQSNEESVTLDTPHQVLNYSYRLKAIAPINGARGFWTAGGHGESAILNNNGQGWLWHQQLIYGSWEVVPR